MAILHAYFDESGKMADHPVVTFTGVCVSQSKLATFDNAWNVLLRQYSLRSLHMAKASRLKENCGPRMPRHQSFAQRIDSLMPFADCMNEHLEVGITQAIDVQGFNLLSANAMKGLGSPTDPYYLAFTRGLREIAKYVQDDDRVSLICDDDETTAIGCYAHYRGIRRVDPEVKAKAVSITFANDEYFPALQAADMLAFLSRLQAKKEFYGDFNPFERLFISLVTERGPGHAVWFKMFADKQKLIDLGVELGKLKTTRRKHGKDKNRI